MHAYLWLECRRVRTGFQTHPNHEKQVALPEEPSVPMPKRQHRVELRVHPGFFPHLSRRRVWEILAGVNQTFQTTQKKRLETEASAGKGKNGMISKRKEDGGGEVCHRN